jgi:hypothetical protein
MNLRGNKPLMARLRKLGYYCCFGFAPAVAGKTAERYIADLGKSGSRIEAEQVGPSHPYLATIGSPPLRFRDPVIMAAALVQTPVGKPPHPAEVPKPAAAGPAGSRPAPKATALVSAGPKPEPPPGGAAPPGGQPGGVDQPQPSIIPDEMRPRVRPEEILPFFQPPGSGAPDAPAPDKLPVLPPSSATLRQE